MYSEAGRPVEEGGEMLGNFPEVGPASGDLAVKGMWRSAPIQANDVTGAYFE